MAELTGPLRPPAQAEPYVEALGLESAVEFLLAFGGTEIYIAQSPKSRSRVAEVVGHEKAEALGRITHRLPRRVPLCKPWIARLAKARGLPPENKPLTQADIARRLHASDVTVRKWLNSAGASSAAYSPDPDQLDLF